LLDAAVTDTDQRLRQQLRTRRARTARMTRHAALAQRVTWRLM